MRLYHITLLFIIILISFMVITDIKTDNFKTVIENKEQINDKLDAALDDGIARLAEVDANNNITINKDAAVQSFFMSISSSFGILADKTMQQKLNLYIPVITITMEDGYYVFYTDSYVNTDGRTYTTKRWSEKLPYYYEDNDFIYGFTLGNIVTLYDKYNLLGGGEEQKVYQMDYHDLQTKSEYTNFGNLRPNSILLEDEAYALVRKGTIIKCIEKTMSYYTSRHNQIASHFGITYQFSLPVMKEKEWAPFVDDVSMFVVFQGYPYGNQAGETYNRIATSGAKISKRRVFYKEQKDWYMIFHREDCSELNKEGLIFWDEPEYSELACYEQGCYNCPICFGNGAFPPKELYLH